MGESVDEPTSGPRPRDGADRSILIVGIAPGQFNATRTDRRQPGVHASARHEISEEPEAPHLRPLIEFDVGDAPGRTKWRRRRR